MNSDRGVLGRVAVALDTADFDEFAGWCDLFGPRVGVLKVGLEAFVRWGGKAVTRASAGGADVFLDLKLHDIPATVGGAVDAAADLGVRWLTVHASGGRTMMSAASAAAGERMGILAVTVLTSLNEEATRELDWSGPIADRVSGWAELAAACGCAGVITSPQEVARLRAERSAGFRLVTPGIRPAGAERGDQSRIATPGEALTAGADLLVIGRPLTRAGDRQRALEALEKELVRGPQTTR